VDPDGKEQKGYTFVFVTVLNENDHTPIFNEQCPFEFSVSEDHGIDNE